MLNEYDEQTSLAHDLTESPKSLCNEEQDKVYSRPPSPLSQLDLEPLSRSTIIPITGRRRKSRSLSSFTLPIPFIRPRPIPNSYWATPLLLACEYPWTPHRAPNAKCKLDRLLKAGVRTFIDLTECGELCSYATAGVLPLRFSIRGEDGDDDDGNSDLDRIEYYNFPIPDRSLPPSLPFLLSILSQISTSLSQGRTTAVHCRGGIGRTGTVIGCYLVQSGIARDGEDALTMIAELWKGVEKCKLGRYKCSPETGEQEEFVRGFRQVV